MKLPVIPFDVAQDLKGLGFDWECRYWDGDRDLSNYRGIGYLKIHSYIPSPEQSLVVKWLREVHSLDILIRRCSVYYKGYIYELWEGNDFLDSNEFVENLTYEDAELEGIREAIKYLKDEKIN